MMQRQKVAVEQREWYRWMDRQTNRHIFSFPPCSSETFPGYLTIYFPPSPCRTPSEEHSLLHLQFLSTVQLFISNASPHSDLWRPCRKFHTISPHSSGCTSTGSQYVAIIGPVVGAESKAINPFLLLFAPWLAVTGCSIIGQEHTCPLRFTLISLQLQTLTPARLRIPLLPPISTQSLFPALRVPPVNHPPVLHHHINTVG